MIDNYTIKDSFNFIEANWNGGSFVEEVLNAISFAYQYTVNEDEISASEHELIERAFSPLGKLNQVELAVYNIAPRGYKPQVLAPINKLYWNYLYKTHTSRAIV